MLFAVGSTLVNCTNSYDVEKPDPQMVELAKYAKQHVPEEHPKVPLHSSFFFMHNNPFMILHTISTTLLFDMNLSFFSCGRMHLPM